VTENALKVLENPRNIMEMSSPEALVIGPEAGWAEPEA